MTVPGDLPAVIGVRDQLVQVFLNLILNAIDATGTGGHIEVRAEAQQYTTSRRSMNCCAEEVLTRS